MIPSQTDGFNRAGVDHQAAAHLDLGVGDHPQLVIAVDGCIVAVFGGDLVLGHIHPGDIGLQRVDFQSSRVSSLLMKDSCCTALTALLCCFMHSHTAEK